MTLRDPIFSLLPLYIRAEVLRGEAIYCPDERFLYDVTYRTIGSSTTLNMDCTTTSERRR
ncbi:hypothetical protein [Methanoculleus caldifontis]|uniref:hypothetical protein n=1 Tax=Methanoculleus caldifontis TaxID=2651577 RepID=UPI002936FC7B|nr:hypothetical protein [Methanoculleus sp. Wushi-C6]